VTRERRTSFPLVAIYSFSSSSEGFFHEAFRRTPGLFLRNCVLHKGDCSPVLEIIPRSFECCRIRFLWISRTVEVIGDDGFGGGHVAFLAFKDPTLEMIPSKSDGTIETIINDSFWIPSCF
jgi:hypothetical protein